MNASVLDVAAAAAAREAMTASVALRAQQSELEAQAEAAARLALQRKAKAAADEAAAEEEEQGAFAVFTVHGKTVKFSKRSCLCLGEDSSVRLRLVQLTQWVWFERFVLLLILANSIILGLADYSAVDAEGELDPANARNRVMLESELFFTIIFTVECGLKILAMGFVVDRGSYLRDPWNVLDFLVVAGGLVGVVPGVPNLSAIRTIRVLRPLRSLVIVPGMRLLVTSLLRSIPGLLNVVALMLFVFAIFGILGLQLWTGLLHTRCRLTSAPVRFTGASGPLGACAQPNSDACAAALLNGTAMAGVEALTLNGTSGLAGSSWVQLQGLELCRPGVPNTDEGWVQDTSPWRTPRECFWPVDPTDESFCSLGTGGAWECPNAAGARWCGSDYDNVGNARFASASVMAAANFLESQNWGYIVFDHMGLALLAIFQSITLEGWTTIMYHTMDVYTPFVAGLYFVVLVLFGSFFLLNLTLAVIWENFSKGQEEEAAEGDKAAAKERAKRGEQRAQLAAMRAAARKLEEEDAALLGEEGGTTVPGAAASAAPTPQGGPATVTPSDTSVTGGAAAPFAADAAGVVSVANLNASGFTSEQSAASGTSTAADAASGGAPLGMLGASSADPDNRGARALSAQGRRHSGPDTLPPHAGVSAPAVAEAIASPPLAASPARSTPNPGGRPPAGTSPGSAASGGSGGSSRGSPTLSGGLRGLLEAKGRSTPPTGAAGGGSGTSPTLFTHAHGGAGGGDSKAGAPPALMTALAKKMSEADLHAAANRLEQLKAARRQAKSSARLTGSPRSGGSSPSRRKGDGGRLASSAAAGAGSADSSATADSTGSAAVRRYGEWVVNAGIPPATRLAEARRREVWLTAAPWRRAVHNLVRDDLFTGSITVLILVNTGVLAADRYPIGAADAEGLEIVNFICTMVFAVEMVLKLAGLGPAEYVRDSFNIFDGVIVITSFVELGLTPPSFLASSDGGSSAGGGISALRTFRLFRVFKLAASWPSLRNLLNTILKTVKDIANFAVLLMLFMYIFALVGMQFFANQLCFQPDTGLRAPAAGTGTCPPPFERPRANFDNLVNAVATVFMVLTGENWNSVMYDCWRGAGDGAVIYFILLVVIGNFIVLNLFLAILLGNFEGIDLSGGGPDHAAEVAKQGPGASKARDIKGKVGGAVRRLSRQASSTLSWVMQERERAQPAPPLGAAGGIRSTRSQRLTDAMDETPFFEDLPWYRQACALISGHVHRRHGADAARRAAGARVVPLGAPVAGGSIVAPRMGAPPTSLRGTGVSGSSLASTPEDSPALPQRPPASTGSSSALSVANPFLGSASSGGTTPGGVAAGRRRRPGPPPGAPRRRPSAPHGAAAVPRTQPMAPRGSPGARKQLRIDEGANTAIAAGRSTSGASSGARRGKRQSRIPSRSSGGRRPRPRGGAGRNKRGSVMATLLSPLGVGTSATGRSKGAAARHKRQSTFAPPTPAPPAVRMHGKSLCCLPPSNPLRRAAFALVTNAWFDRFILLLILLSSITLAIDNPLRDPASTTARALVVLDILLTALFTAEFVAKVLALGFVAHEGAYLRDGWNVLDGAIVVISITALALGGNPTLASLRALRALRALRPLRVISRRPGLRLVVNALIGSIKSILNVVLVVLMMFLIFGILAVNYFKGAFHLCTGDGFEGLSPPTQELITYPSSWADLGAPQRALFNGSAPEHAAAVAAAGVPTPPTFFLPRYTSQYATSPPVSRLLCEVLGGTWEAALASRFDNIFMAIGTLFEMSTTEGWADVMWQGVDSRGVEMQPVRDFRSGWVWFFIVFMVIGSFFAVNLFVGVVIDNFNQMKAKQGGSILLTDEQKEWVRTQEAMMKLQPFVQPPPATGPVMAWCQGLVASPTFEGTIVTCIMLNTLTMAMEYFGQPTAYDVALTVCNYFFGVVFLLEAILKLTALQWTYFHSSWNKFDFIVVLASIVGVIVQFSAGVDIGSVATVIRTFRVLRVLRLVKRARRLNQLFKTLLLTLPSLGNIGALLFLLIFIYAVMGVQLFAPVAYGDFIDRHANFQTFGGAMMVLLRAATGESWNGIMHEAANREECVDLDTVDYGDKRTLCGYSTDLATCEPITGCGTPLSFVYFISFTVFVSFVFLNLLIAVVIEGFSETDDSGMRLSDENFDSFRDGWVKYDPDGEGVMPSRRVTELLQELPEPLGFGEYEASQRELQARLTQLDLKVTADGGIRFHDMGQALAKRVFEESLREQGKDFKIPDHLAWESESEDSDTEEWALEHYLAATKIYRFCARIILQRRALRELAAVHNIVAEDLAELGTDSGDDRAEAGAGAAAGSGVRLSRAQRRSLAMSLHGYVPLARPFGLSQQRLSELRARRSRSDVEGAAAENAAAGVGGAPAVTLPPLGAAESKGSGGSPSLGRTALPALGTSPPGSRQSSASPVLHSGRGSTGSLPPLARPAGQTPLPAIGGAPLR